MPPPRPLPDKLFFRIGEVASLVGVKPHVLRYWESEFSALRPMKTRGAHRQYRRRDVELAMLIKQLVHDEKYTIAGAKKRLRELGHHRRDADLPETATRQVSARAALLGVRQELTALIKRLDAAVVEAEREDQEPVTVTVHRAVPVPAWRKRSRD